MQNSAPGAFASFFTVDRDAKRVAVTMLVALIVGSVFVVFGSTPAWGGLLWAAACSAVGWFLGFLFGIPRTLSSDTARTSLPPMRAGGAPPMKTGGNQAHGASATPDLATRSVAGAASGNNGGNDAGGAAPAIQVVTGADSAASGPDAGAAPVTVVQANVDTGGPDPGSTYPLWRGPSTEVNTNLEQISDWLTKIIVGVTLVELPSAFTHLDAAAVTISGAIGGPNQKSFAYAIMVYFSTSGFLGSYLLTRLFLQRALGAANAGSDYDVPADPADGPSQ